MTADPTPENQLAAFLATDPADVGCGEALRLLDVYADLLHAGEDPEARLPGLTAHFRACGPCGEDLDGLIAALRGDRAG